MMDLWKDLWRIYGGFMEDLWRIYGGFMEDLGNSLVNTKVPRKFTLCIYSFSIRQFIWEY